MNLHELEEELDYEELQSQLPAWPHWTALAISIGCTALCAWLLFY